MGAIILIMVMVALTMAVDYIDYKKDIRLKNEEKNIDTLIEEYNKIK